MNFKLTDCLFFIHLFFSLSTYSQTDFKVVSGKVLDFNGKPLPFSSLFIKGKAIGTVTNENGEFTFNIPIFYQLDTLTVSYVGYKNFTGIVRNLPAYIKISLNEAVVDLAEVSVQAKALTGNEIFALAIKKILSDNPSSVSPFRMEGFYREVHSTNSMRTGVVECAVEIDGKNVSERIDDISIPQFRKMYDKQKNTDEFIDWKAGKNHLLLLLNDGINLIPLANKIKSTVWRNRVFAIEKITYFNNQLVYLLSYKSPGMELRVMVGVDDYSAYKNEMIITANEASHENYAWAEMNTKGEKCGAILDHQSYEYRSINGRMFPYYFFRKQDFRCFHLKQEKITGKSFLSSELLINSVSTKDFPKASVDKLKKQKGLIRQNEPYDSTFWRHFNDIQEVDTEQSLASGFVAIAGNTTERKEPKQNANKLVDENLTLKIGDHAQKRFTRADTLFGSLTPLLTCYDVGHYQLDIDIDVAKEFISGYSEMTFRVVEPTSRIRLDLFEYLKINSIQFNSTNLHFTRDLDAVYVQFDKVLEKGSVHTLRVNYEGRLMNVNFNDFTGSFIWQTDENNNPWCQSLCQGYGAKGWWPVKNHISDEPDSAAISISVPENLYAVSNGNLISASPAGNGKMKYQWAVSNPINNYNLAVHIGNYKSRTEKFQSSTGKNLTLSYYFMESDENLANQKLAMVPVMLNIYEKYFGPYPFLKDGFKIVQSPYPMEHQSCVAVGQFFDEQLILHESAHEWWGNSVSCADNSDIWIHEAFATYAESLYIEETLGYSIGQEYLNSKKDRILNDFPLVGVKGVNHFHYRIEDKYFKGALMLNTLRHLVGDDKIWFSTLKGIQEEFRHSFIDTEMLIAYFNKKLQNDFTTFFNQYLRTTDIPILTVQKISTTSFQFKWSNTINTFKMKLKWGSALVIEPTSNWLVGDVSNILSPDIIKEIETNYLIKVSLK
jgi:Peptidase family M1 domain/CarboxypepD_reg-like domain/Peptidase M1 N-terminal domain